MLVNIRYLQQGLIQEEAPKGFLSWSKEMQLDWAQMQLRNYPQQKVMIGLCNDLENGNFWEENPAVCAVEKSKNSKTIVHTKEWNVFAFDDDSFKIMELVK